MVGIRGAGVAMIGVLMLVLFGFFFFFQAEDGIRDWSVTGVQTCALPICAVEVDGPSHYLKDAAGRCVTENGSTRFKSRLLRQIGRASCRERV